jgi:small redox-active disulfide protein 2
MDIKVLGPGCAKCHALDKIVHQVVEELNVPATIDYIQDMRKILEYPILTTPGLVINGEVICAGRLPSKDEVTGWIKAEAVKGKG